MSFFVDDIIETESTKEGEARLMRDNGEFEVNLNQFSGEKDIGRFESEEEACESFVDVVDEKSRDGYDGGYCGDLLGL